jgi:hypothetical protein
MSDARSAPLILILSSPSDDEAAAVAQLLQRRGARAAWFDTGTFPESAQLDVSACSESPPKCILHLPCGPLDLDEVSTVWYRRPSPPAVPASMSARERAFVSDECNHVLASLWSIISAEWFPGPPEAIRLANRKLWQLELARRLGFEIPQSRLTNSPAGFIAQLRTHHGRLISKLYGDAFHHHFPELARYTKRVSPAEVATYRAVKRCPVFVQAEVPKRVELRVTVIGEEIFAAEIDSQASKRHALDWRRSGSKDLCHRRHQLPAEIAERCRNLIRGLGLRYGAIDLIVRPDDVYVFLEINPGGRCLWRF